MRTETSQIRRLKAAKRLKVVRRLPQVGPPAGVDDPRRHPGHPARAAPPGAARRRPVRDQRPERPLPARDQPQQPVEEAARAARPRGHRAQREADAPGGGRRPVRQRPPRPRAQGLQQPPPEVALRHAQGQAGALPAEPARQARRLLGPFGHRRRPRAQAVTSAACRRRWRSSCSSRSSTTGSRRRGWSAPSRPPRRWWRPRWTRSGTRSRRSSRTIRCCSTARRRCTAWASRRSSRR